VAAGSFVSGLPAQPHNKTAEQFINIARLTRLYGKAEELNTRLTAVERAMQK